MKHTIIKQVFIAMLAYTATSVNADIIDTEKQVDPSVSFASAVEIVNSAAPGKIMSIELEPHSNPPIYIAEVEASSSITLLRIDGTNGNILAKAVATGSNMSEVHAIHNNLAGIENPHDGGQAEHGNH